MPDHGAATVLAVAAPPGTSPVGGPVLGVDGQPPQSVQGLSVATLQAQGPRQPRRDVLCMGDAKTTDKLEHLTSKLKFFCKCSAQLDQEGPWTDPLSPSFRFGRCTPTTCAATDRLAKSHIACTNLQCLVYCSTTDFKYES